MPSDALLPAELAGDTTHLARATPGWWARTGSALEYWLVQYRAVWRGTLVSSVLSPLLFLTAMGVGLGSLVDDAGRLGGEYLLFLAPGLMAATAMQTATFESTYPVAGGIKWVRTYHAMLATPLGPVNILVGHLSFVALRVLSVSAIYLVILALFGIPTSYLALLAPLAAALAGMAFATPIFALAAGTDNDGAFAAVERFVIVPLFLFSGTFFPVRQLPDAIEWLAYVTPLWHGVELCRDLVGGVAAWGSSLVHVGYLALWVAGGALVAARVFRRRLESTG